MNKASMIHNNEAQQHSRGQSVQCPNSMTLNSWIVFPNHLFQNKMKPTNPNADTYVEEQRQHLFLTFSSEPTCETPWVDTLRWHSCRTSLLDTIAQRFLFDALAWHSCLTLLYDTLTWHCLLDTLVRHSYLTRFLDTCVGHSYLTLL